MTENARSWTRLATKLTVLGIGSAAATAAFLSLGAATASADVREMAPRPNVTSRQATVVDQNALRRSAQGEARGFWGSTRSADSGIVHSQGEVRDSVKAVVGTRSAPFGVRQNGEFRQGAPIGSW
ncbi:hypothetical protein BCA37_07170 [Mycobacterium sp. djl-10]|nr:hypothetical protein BCA37_07170 [Mycobacterium sp. djl-10]